MKFLRALPWFILAVVFALAARYFGAVNTQDLWTDHAGDHSNARWFIALILGCLAYLSARWGIGVMREK